MRPHSYVPVILLSFGFILSSCAGDAQKNVSSGASPAATPTIAPLRSCETREFRYRGADVVLVANVNGTLSSLTVIAARSMHARERAMSSIVAQLGAPHPDTSVEQRPWKDGLIELTDPCGRVVTPSPAPT